MSNEQLRTSQPSQTSTEIPLPPAGWQEIKDLTALISLRRLELENAELRRELAIRRTIDQIGCAGRRVTLELDIGVARVHDDEATS